MSMYEFDMYVLHKKVSSYGPITVWNEFVYWKIQAILLAMFPLNPNIM